MGIKNIKLKGISNSSVFRKIAMGTWKTAKDPSVYGILEIDMENCLAHLNNYEKRTRVKVTPGHIVGKVFARALKLRPEANGFIRGSKIYLREHVQLFYQVNIPGSGKSDDDKTSKATLAGLIIPNAENKSLKEISKEIETRAKLIRDFKDKEISKNLQSFKYIPWWFAKYYLNIASWLMYGLNLNLSKFGLPRDPFGSIMITNVGGMGIDIGLAPLCPYTRVPILVTVGEVSKRPVVINDEIVIRPIMRLGITFDHRIMDGIHGSKMAEIVKQSFNEPEKYIFNE